MVENTAGEIKPSGTGYTVLTLKMSYILLKLLHRIYKMHWYYWENRDVLNQQRWTINVNIYLCLLSTFPQKDSKHFKYISIHETSVNNLTSIQMLFPHFRRGKYIVNYKAEASIPWYLIFAKQSFTCHVKGKRTISWTSETSECASHTFFLF